MTERAHEREIYKSKKRLPAPEVPKPKNHHKPEKNILIQERWKPEYVEEVNKKAAAFGVKTTTIGKRTFNFTLWMIGKNEWMTTGKYVDIKTAEMVLEKNKLKFFEYRKNHEYRIIHKDDLKEEKETKKIMKATEEVLKKDWDNPEENKAWEKL